jgi:hypothetical protein
MPTVPIRASLRIQSRNEFLLVHSGMLIKERQDARSGLLDPLCGCTVRIAVHTAQITFQSTPDAI